MVEKDMTVDVIDGKIKSINPSSSKNSTKADTVVDCKGKFLMPDYGICMLILEKKKAPCISPVA
jgi:hypothetical protein